jgi:phosphoribosylanthranilate isomerase
VPAVRDPREMVVQFLSAQPGRVRVKVCCISSKQEATLALQAGADALGLVTHMPSGPGIVTDDKAAAIAEWIGTRAATVLLTSRQTAAGIAEQVTQVCPTIVQLCDAIPPDEYDALRASLPNVLLMQVVHVQGPESVAEAAALAPLVDALLLDSGRPGADVKELGGTGRRHDWSVSRAICEAVHAPVFLAGGLTPMNVREAIETVRPFGVDVCTGVRRGGMLDSELVHAFVHAVTECD